MSKAGHSKSLSGAILSIKVGISRLLDGAIWVSQEVRFPARKPTERLPVRFEWLCRCLKRRRRKALFLGVELQIQLLPEPTNAPT